MNYYSEDEARSLVLKAGLRLKEEKLIARTWGNISARISETEFIITPSGLAYETLKPEELVKVNLENGSFEGAIKPSSEKGIHAVAYSLRNNIKFIIHTHQLYASAICAEMKDTEFAPCAKYGLSGSAKLRDNVKLLIAKRPLNKAFLMARHGVLCLGESYDDAFEVTEKLEEDSRILFQKKARSKGDDKPWLDDYAQLFDYNGNPAPGEDQEAIELIRKKNDVASRYVCSAKPINPLLAAYEHCIYTKKYSKLKK